MTRVSRRTFVARSAGAGLALFLGEGTALFVANERYFLGAPFVGRIESLSVDNELLALQAGEIDVAETPPEGVPDEVLAPFGSGDAFGLVPQTGGFTFPLLWNLARGGALGDVRFRRACALAIERGAIVRRVVAGNGVVEGLARVGIELAPLAVDLPTLFGRLEEGAYELAVSLYPGPGGTAPNADPDGLRTFYSSRIEGRLQGARGYVDEEFDRLSRQQLVAADRDQRLSLVARMQRLIANDVPALPLYYPTLYSAFRRNVLDQWYYTPGGVAGGLPTVLNKHLFVTGSKTGLEIRRSS